MTSPVRGLHPRNAMTYSGLLLGMAATASALEGRAAAAGALLALAVIADTFDGRFARLFTSDPVQKRMGIELDSLCDACTFGLAPVICTAALVPAGGERLAVWVGGCLYLGAAVTRLAFYNITHDQVRGFVGLPAPVAALIWCSVLCVTAHPGMLSAVLAITGAGMVAPLRLPRPAGPGLVAFALWPVATAATHVLHGYLSG